MSGKQQSEDLSLTLPGWKPPGRRLRLEPQGLLSQEWLRWDLQGPGALPLNVALREAHPRSGVHLDALSNAAAATSHTGY